MFFFGRGRAKGDLCGCVFIVPQNLFGLIYKLQVPRSCGIRQRAKGQK